MPNANPSYLTVSSKLASTSHTNTLFMISLKNTAGLWLLISALLLCGCQIGILTPLKVSQLEANKNNTLQATLYINIDSCSENKNLGKEGSQLKKAKTKISEIFTGASYAQCLTKSFSNFAAFSIPVDLIHGKIENIEKLSRLSINHTGNGNSVLMVPTEMAKKIIAYKDEEPSMLDLKVGVKIINDTLLPFKKNVMSVYVNDQPNNYAGITIAPNEAAIIQLSDVGVAALLKGQYSFLTM